jgi:CBS domain-containing protein
MAPETAIEPQEPAVSTEDFQAALGDMTTYVDITADDLYTLYILARRHARARLRTQQAVREIMTTAVVTVDRDADLHDVARVLSEHRISGVPVVDAARHVLGVVSEADLLALAGMPRGHTVLDLLRYLLGEPLPVQKGGTTAGDVMTAPALTIPPDTSIQDAAEILHARHVKRLPVVDGDQRLVGIISRGDLVKVMSTR